MDGEPRIVVRRYEYEEPYYTHLDLSVSSRGYALRLLFYVDVAGIKELGAALSQFPKRVGDRYRWEIGSEDPAVRCAEYLLIEAYTFNNKGDTALKFRANENAIEPTQAVAEFSMQCDPAAINRLGQILVEFARCEHDELRWTPTSGELIR